MKSIQNLRNEIDQIDAELSALLLRRVSITFEIWNLKAKEQIQFVDVDREQQVLQKIKNQFQSLRASSADQAQALELFTALLVRNRELLAKRIELEKN